MPILKWREVRMDGLWKTDRVRQQLIAGKSPEHIIESWEKELDFFVKIREGYLLY